MRKQKNAPAVLLYQLPEFSMQGRTVRAWLAEQGIRSVTVGPDDGGKTLASLLGLKREADGPKCSLPGEPMVVLYGLVGPTFDDFLMLLDRTGRIALKAVATPYNLHWSFGKLAEQLQDERHQISGWQQNAISPIRTVTDRAYRCWVLGSSIIGYLNFLFNFAGTPNAG